MHVATRARSRARPRALRLTTLAIALAVASAACALDGGDFSPGADCEISISEWLRTEGPLPEVHVGDTVQLGLLTAACNFAGERPDVRWSSSAPAVAWVDGQGKVSARAVGTATIRARIEEVRDSIPLVVLP